PPGRCTLPSEVFPSPWRGPLCLRKVLRPPLGGSGGSPWAEPFHVEHSRPPAQASKASAERRGTLPSYATGEARPHREPLTPAGIEARRTGARPYLEGRGLTFGRERGPTFGRERGPFARARPLRGGEASPSGARPHL